MKKNQKFPCLGALNVPNLITISSVFAGVLAVLFALKGKEELALMVYPLTILFDTLDGFAARRLNQTSEIGLQLDSLADFSGFGVIPVILFFILGGGSWMILPGALFYILAAIMRLAYFNVYGMEEDGTYFVGVPSTISAAWLFLISMLVWNVMPEMMPPVALAAMTVFGLLMVSGIRYKKRGLISKPLYVILPCSVAAEFFIYLWK